METNTKEHILSHNDYLKLVTSQIVLNVLKNAYSTLNKQIESKANKQNLENEKRKRTQIFIKLSERKRDNLSNYTLNFSFQTKKNTTLFIYYFFYNVIQLILMNL